MIYPQEFYFVSDILYILDEEQEYSFMINFKVNKYEIYLIQVTYTLFEFVHSVTAFVSPTSNFVIPLFNI